MLGNLSGDFIKGKVKDHLHEEIAIGAKLHRQIDLFTDNHPLVLDAKKIVRGEFGLYSGVIIDMFFDYFLASKWNHQSSSNFQIHIQEVYNQAEKNFDILPGKFQTVLPYMKKFNWLNMYATSEGLKEILIQMSNRINGKIDLSTSIKTLLYNQDELESLFNAFWKDISTQFEVYPKEILII